jgi:hypothetical protein
MDPLSPEFTRNLMRQKRHLLDGMDRVMRPGGIATPEGHPAALRAEMQHFATNKDEASTAIASAKGAGDRWTDSVRDVAVPTDAGVGKPGIHREPAAAPDQLDPQAEHSSEPRPVWHGFVPTSPRHGPASDSIRHLTKEAEHLVESAGTFVYNHSISTLAALATEALGGRPEDPVADGAVAGEVTAAESLGAKTGTVRALSASDLGLNAGSLTELSGTVSTTGTDVAVDIRMIEGIIAKPFEMLETLISVARAHGATTLTIRGTIANERLLKIVLRRYGGRTLGGIEQIVIPIRK